MPPTAPPPPIDPFDMIPDPAVVHAQLREMSRASRVLRRQLKLSLDARRMRADGTAHAPVLASSACLTEAAARV